MKKTLLSLQSVLSRCCLLLALLAVSVSAVAQQKTLNFTYFQLTEEESDDYQQLGLGDNSVVNEVYSVAIFVPAELAGKKIEEVSFVVNSPSNVTDLKVWASTKLPSSASAATLFCQDVTASADVKERISTQIEGNHVVPTKGCYVGYSLKVTSIALSTGKNPVIVDQGPGCAGGCFIKTSTLITDWTDLALDLDLNTSIAVTLTGENFNSNAAKFQSTSFSEKVALKGTNTSATVSIFNNSFQPISSFSYVLEDLSTNETFAEKTINLSGTSVIKPYVGDYVQLPIPANTAGFHNYRFKLTKVNGVANEMTKDVTLTGNVLCLNKSEKRTVLEEEFTGTWCGWCPMGIVGMDRCMEQYPDDWIGIAIHGDDYITSNDFNPLLNKVSSGFPSCFVDRAADIYPLYVAQNMPKFLQNPSEAALRVNAYWNETQDSIIVISETTFSVDRDDAPYGVAYVLVGDDINSGSAGKQNNYLSGQSYSDADLQEWAAKPEKVTMNYDHVGIAALSIMEGVEGSIQAPIVAGRTQKHTALFDITDGFRSTRGVEMIQDIDRLSVVAILINRNNGRVVNAAQTTIAEYVAGIENLQGEDTQILEHYTIDGKRTNGFVKGLNILKLSNGKVVKVLK